MSTNSTHSPDSTDSTDSTPTPRISADAENTENAKNTENTETLPTDGITHTEPLPTAGVTATMSPEEAEAAATITDMTTPNEPSEPDKSGKSSDPTKSSDPGRKASARPGPDGVWTSSSLEREPHQRRPVRRTTLAWGMILAILGGLVGAFGAGLHIDLAATGIVLLGGTGLLILLAALIPHSPKSSAQA